MLMDHPVLNTYRAELISEGDPRYAAAQEVAREDIKAIDRLHKEARQAPIWIFDGWDEDGEPIMAENTDPWDRLQLAKESVAENPNAVGILMAEGRLELISENT